MILLIEDRVTRQQHILDDVGFSLDAYSDIVENAVGQKYEDVYAALKEDAFDFSKYSFIISHKSAFGVDYASIIKKLEKGCAEHNIPLVFFTGNSSTSYHDNQNNYAEISSTTLYSENLKLLLESSKEDKNNILILLYGSNWKLNILLSNLEKINLFLQDHDEEKVFYKRFVSNHNIDNLFDLDTEIYKPQVDGKYTSLNEIKELTKSLENIAKGIIHE